MHAKEATPVFQPSDLLTPEELCARLKVRREWPYEQMRARPRQKNPIPVIKMGRLLRYSWTAVSAWLESQKVPARKARI
jgi:predicted DNA-binding transcriptional regulator AlpA